MVKCLLRLMRITNCLIIAVATVAGYVVSCSGDVFSYQLLYLLASVFLISAAGNIINDYYDYGIDLINKPYRPLPSGEISLRTARIVAVVFFMLRVLASMFTYNIYCILTSILASVPLYLYA